MAQNTNLVPKVGQDAEVIFDGQIRIVEVLEVSLDDQVFWTRSVRNPYAPQLPVRFDFNQILELF